MKMITAILIGLQAAIAARAARDQRLTLLLVAVWGRVGRARVRLERLVAQWRAGTLPAVRPARDRSVDDGPARAPRVRPAYPRAPAWLVRKLGYDVVGFGLQLEHALSEAECAAFLAAVPRAGRILRPLLRMLGVDPLPVVVRKPAPVAYAVGAAGQVQREACISAEQGMQFFGA